MVRLLHNIFVYFGNFAENCRKLALLFVLLIVIIGILQNHTEAYTFNYKKTKQKTPEI